MNRKEDRVEVVKCIDGEEHIWCDRQIVVNPVTGYTDQNCVCCGKWYREWVRENVNED